MKARLALTAVIIMTVISTCTFAANPAQVTINATDMKLDQVAAEMTKQMGVAVVCDTAVRGTVNGSFSNIEPEKLLDIITKPNNLKWQKLYLPILDGKLPTIEQIKAQADAVAAIADIPVVVYDPATKKQTVFVRQKAEEATIAPDKLGLKPLYFISAPKVEAKKDDAKKADGDAMAKFNQAQSERQDALAKMTPEQRVAAYQQEMVEQMNMDPNLRAQMFMDNFNARRNMDPQMRDQYRNMMRDTFRQLRDSGQLPDWHGGPDGQGHPNGGDFGGHHGRDGGNNNGQ